MKRLAPVLALYAMLAACDRPAGNVANNAVNMVDTAENAAVANGAGNVADPVRSILRPEVAEPEAPRIEPLDTVIAFGASGLKLDDAARAALDALVDTPAMKTGGAITLRGHSDSKGNDGDNRVASRIRAEAVEAYLVEKGIAQDRITLIALGETRPVVANAKEDGSDDPEGRAKNRRVDIHVAVPTVVVPTAAVLPSISPVDRKEKP